MIAGTQPGRTTELISLIKEPGEALPTLVSMEMRLQASKMLPLEPCTNRVDGHLGQFVALVCPIFTDKSDIIHHMLMYESNEYRASKDWPYAFCSGTVVYRSIKGKTEVLLLVMSAQNDRTEENFVTYHLPKGHVCFHETIIEAAKRETLEETGAEVDIKTYLGAIQKEYKFRGNLFNKSFQYFAAEWVKDVRTIDDEHDSREWVDIDKAIKLLGKPNPKGEDEIVRRLKKFLEITR